MTFPDNREGTSEANLNVIQAIGAGREPNFYFRFYFFVDGDVELDRFDRVVCIARTQSSGTTFLTERLKRFNFSSGSSEDPPHRNW